MLPLLTFASGLVAGIVGIRLLKTVKAPENLKAATGTIGDKARHGIEQAQSGLRQATMSGLTAIEKSSASLRAKLAPEPAESEPASAVKAKRAARKAKPAASEGAAEPAASEGAAKPPVKRRLKAKPAAPEAGTES